MSTAAQERIPPVAVREGIDKWRALRRAVREAASLGAEFRISGAVVEIDGLRQLPDRLVEVLDQTLLLSYLGAHEDDEAALDFLDELGVEAVLVTTAQDAEIAQIELGERPPYVGLDIETKPKPEFAEPRTPIPINADGGVGARRKAVNKHHKHAALDPHRADIATLQLFAGGARAFVFHRDALAWILSSPWLRAQLLVAHGAAFEESFLHPYSLRPIWCTLQAGGLLVGTGFGGEARSLANVSKMILGLEPPKALQTSDWGAEYLSPGQVAYAASDAILAHRLWPKLRRGLADAGCQRAFILQQRAIPAVIMMERRGLLLDRVEHARQVAEWSRELGEARRQFIDVTDEGAPPASDNAIREWMTRTVPPDDMIDWPRTPKTGLLSVERKHLKRLLPLSGVAEILTMKLRQQLISNFGDKLAGFISPATGRIHPSFNLAATKSGRFSASKPNLQQFPADVAAPDFRRCIVAAPGRVLITCDWSQVEMRAAAWISADRALTGVYSADPVRDLHRETAAAIARVPYAAVSPEQRQAAKPVNFGSIYGIGAVSLSEDAFDSYGIVMTEHEAQLSIDRFFETYRGFNDWRWRNWRKVKMQGRVIVPGSWRTVEREWEPNGSIRFTQACNIPIQGICADAMLLALHLVHARLNGCRAQMVASVHDEILVEADEDDADRAKAALEESMIEAFETTFPEAPSYGVVASGIGRDWKDAKPQ